MVSFSGSLLVLPAQSLQEGRALVIEGPSDYLGGVFYGTQVSASQPVCAASVSRTLIQCRGFFLPIMIVTMPMPQPIRSKFPQALVKFCSQFAIWTFSAVLIIPWLLCVFKLITNTASRSRRLKDVLDEDTAPKIVVVIPVYKEDPSILIKAVDSVAESDYPAACIHIFLSYDGGPIDKGFHEVLEHLGIYHLHFDVEHCQSFDVLYQGLRITISRFDHGGKRQCQKKTFLLVSELYEGYLENHDDVFMLFIDSDCILDAVCIQNFMYDMQLKPGGKNDVLAMTGIITSTTRSNTFLTVLQDVEYIHGQLFERSVESACGAVTCLPGALTMLRFSAFQHMAPFYFAETAEHCEDLFDYCKSHLGEDRWLTHLLMIAAVSRNQIQMCSGAFCKTEAVQTFTSLIKQRRRWFLGYITNEACMMTDYRIWRQYPLLCLVRFMQNTIRTTALLFMVMMVSIATTSTKISDLPVGFLILSLGLNWLMMLIFGIKLRRFKAWSYPLMFFFNPFFNWLYIVYGVLTAGQRTWGGPRADAVAADLHTTVQQAIEQAKAAGDDLNIRPETFPMAAHQHYHTRSGSNLVQPPAEAEGQFAPVDDLLQTPELSLGLRKRTLSGRQRPKISQDPSELWPEVLLKGQPPASQLPSCLGRPIVPMSEERKERLRRWRERQAAIMQHDGSADGRPSFGEHTSLDWYLGDQQGGDGRSHHPGQRLDRFSEPANPPRYDVLFGDEWRRHEEWTLRSPDLLQHRV